MLAASLQPPCVARRQGVRRSARGAVGRVGAKRVAAAAAAGSWGGAVAVGALAEAGPTALADIPLPESGNFLGGLDQGFVITYAGTDPRLWLPGATLPPSLGRGRCSRTAADGVTPAGG